MGGYARPMRPDVAPSPSHFASVTTPICCCLTVIPATVTSSVPKIPLAVSRSWYSMAKVSLGMLLKELDGVYTGPKPHTDSEAGFPVWKSVQVNPRWTAHYKNKLIILIYMSGKKQSTARTGERWKHSFEGPNTAISRRGTGEKRERKILLTVSLDPVSTSSSTILSPSTTCTESSNPPLKAATEVVVPLGTVMGPYSAARWVVEPWEERIFLSGRVTVLRTISLGACLAIG